MCDSEEVWQVAGYRRRRRRPGGSEAGRKQHQQQPEIRRNGTARQTHDSAASCSSAGKSKNEASRGGYAYKVSRDVPPLEQTVESKEARVKEELAKLERLKFLLRGTALWQRLVEGLAQVLPQLGLTAPEQDGAPATTAVATSACLGRNCVDEIVEGGPESDLRRSPRELRELVCYGIGNFSENHSSRYQFALALCLRDLLSQTSNDHGPAAPGEAADDISGGIRRTTSGLGQQHRDNETAPSSTAQPKASAAAEASVGGDCSPSRSDQMQGSGSSPQSETNGVSYQEAAQKSGASRVSMLVFDPVMGETERAILAALDCGTLENEEGKRCCCGHVGAGDSNGDCGGDKGGLEAVTPTLFFMPHCPQRLYSNVLWANWSSRALGSIIVLGNKISRYREDRLLDARSRDDPTNALLRAGPLLRDIDLQVPYPASSATGTPEDKGRWRRDSEKLPRLERAFNDLALSFSDPKARSSADGVAALLDRPLEFVEKVDGELVTGRAGT